jgi:HNH endonuclease
VDHFQPRVEGGSDDLENLLYCCFACNSFKGDWWNPDGVERLLHPLLDNLDEHLCQERDGTLSPLTPTGQFHCDRLQLNRLPLVANRLLRLRDAQIEAERQALQDELAETQSRLKELLARFSIKPEP